MSAPVFISYSSKDQNVAETIYQALEARRGQQCWIASRDVRPGENYQEAIVRALRSAKVMLLIFTSNANNSDEIKKELVLAGRHSRHRRAGARRGCRSERCLHLRARNPAMGRPVQGLGAPDRASGGAHRPSGFRRRARGGGIAASAGDQKIFAGPRADVGPARGPGAGRHRRGGVLHAAGQSGCAATTNGRTNRAARSWCPGRTRSFRLRHRSQSRQRQLLPAPPAAPPLQPTPALSPDEAAWQIAAAAATREAFAEYLKAFPAGAHAQEAELRIDDLILAGTGVKSNGFDGTWLTTWTCPGVGPTLGYAAQFTAQVKDGDFHSRKGAPGERGSLILNGKIEPDGTAAFFGEGVVGSSAFAVGGLQAGTPYFFFTSPRISTAKAAPDIASRAAPAISPSPNSELAAANSSRFPRRVLPAGFSNRHVQTTRHCEKRSDEAIQNVAAGLDCFASLAMTAVARMERSVIRDRSTSFYVRSRISPRFIRATKMVIKPPPPPPPKGSGTPADAVFHVPHASGARVAPRRKPGLRRPHRCRARSPAGVPPRLSPRGVFHPQGATRARLRGYGALQARTSRRQRRTPVAAKHLARRS